MLVTLDEKTSFLILYQDQNLPSLLFLSVFLFSILFLHISLGGDHFFYSRDLNV